jgi:hypothetical protein
MSLWLLANQDSFREVADRFDIERGLAHRIFDRFIIAFFNLRHLIIKFPVGEDLEVCINNFLNIVKPK